MLMQERRSCHGGAEASNKVERLSSKTSGVVGADVSCKDRIAPRIDTAGCPEIQ